MDSQKNAAKPVVLDEADPQKFAEDAKEMAQNMIAPMKKFVRELEKAVDDCDKILGWLALQPETIPEILQGELGPDLYSQDYVKSIKMRFDKAKTALYYIYWKYCECAYRHDVPSEIAGTSNDPRAVFEVDVRIVEQLLLVKLPLLWSRYGAIMHTGKQCYKTDSLRWFEWELNAALERISDQVPLYMYKNIGYLHVIPKALRTFVDNDNYDTKYITDTITTYLLGTDNGLVCSFSFYGMEEGELPVGSYAIVSPNFNAPPSMDTILPILKDAFLQESRPPHTLPENAGA